LTHTLWIDLEDLFEHEAVSTRPSGIQRVSFEICRALLARDARGPDRVRFVRHDRLRGTLRIVGWSVVEAVFEQLVGQPGGEDPRWSAASRARPAQGRDGPMVRLAYLLPPGLRRRLVTFARLQSQACRALWDVVGALAGGPRGSRRRHAGESAGEFAKAVRPGDFLIVPGAFWCQPCFTDLIIKARQKFGLRLAVLSHDIIPIVRPEWFPADFVGHFSAWLRQLLAGADVILAVSRATAADLERFATRSGITLRSAPHVISLGAGFVPSGRGTSVMSARPRPDRDYVLCVSTIDGRKNQVLLFRVWRRLLEELPEEAVPVLVLAGRPAGLADDLLRQLENTGCLGGKIRLLTDVTDAELADLYAGCLFTVFPSLYEGWGLPVTESFAFGKPCLAARGSSLPESGGDLARYFDPESVSDAYAVIRATIEDPDGLRDWRAEIVRSFVPVPWCATAEAIERHLYGEAAIPEK
jgi:glycosyltransferase involved in cell wall biosynthesis